MFHLFTKGYNSKIKKPTNEKSFIPLKKFKKARGLLIILYLNSKCQFIHH